ncbi:TolC family protein [bacterium]|nr:TolC family protein [bacterium]
MFGQGVVGMIALLIIGQTAGEVGSIENDSIVRDPVITLEQALDNAEAHHEQVRINRHGMEQARLKRDRALAAFLPQVTFTTTLTHYDQEIIYGDRIMQEQDALSGDIQARLPLYSAPLFPAWSKAKSLVASDEHDFEWQTRTFLFEVSQAYYAALSAQNLLQTAERSLETVREHLAATEARLAAGEVLELDLTRARIEVLTAEADLVRAVNAFDGAFDYLSFLIMTDRPFQLANPIITELAMFEPEQLGEQALRARPDVIAREYEIRSGESALREAWLEYLPELYLTATYRGSENTGFSGEEFSWNVLFSLNWLLYDGGKRGADRHEWSAILDISRLHKQLLERSIRLDVKQALRDLVTARATLKTVLGKLELAGHNQELVLERYKAGLATALEIIDADDQLRQAEYAVVTETLNLDLKRLNLFQVLGLDPLGKEISRP